MGTARRFGVRELRNDTSGVLAAAERDGEALITKHGHVVAKVIPFHPGAQSPLAEFLGWAETFQRQSTDWADEYLTEKERTADEVEAKPWE